MVVGTCTIKEATKKFSFIFESTAYAKSVGLFYNS